MSAAKQQPNWTNFLKYYSETNKNRRTRIGIFEKRDGVTNDYWIEDGLPLAGIYLEIENGTQVIEIILEGYTHLAKGVRTLRAVYSIDGSEDGIDFVGPGERTTILRFED